MAEAAPEFEKQIQTHGRDARATFRKSQKINGRGDWIACKQAPTSGPEGCIVKATAEAAPEFPARPFCVQRIVTCTPPSMMPWLIA